MVNTGLIVAAVATPFLIISIGICMIKGMGRSAFIRKPRSPSKASHQQHRQRRDTEARAGSRSHNVQMSEDSNTGDLLAQANSRRQKRNKDSRGTQRPRVPVGNEVLDPVSFAHATAGVPHQHAHTRTYDHEYHQKRYEPASFAERSVNRFDTVAFAQADVWHPDHNSHQPVQQSTRHARNRPTHHTANRANTSPNVGTYPVAFAMANHGVDGFENIMMSPVQRPAHVAVPRGRAIHEEVDDGYRMGISTNFTALKTGSDGYPAAAHQNNGYEGSANEYYDVSPLEEREEISWSRR